MADLSVGDSAFATDLRCGDKHSSQPAVTRRSAWELTTSQGPLHTRRVVLATGACTKPLTPSWPGRNSFLSELIHSSQYRNPVHYAGQRVLVVGSGNSASEVAVDLVSAGDVTVVRSIIRV